MSADAEYVARQMAIVANETYARMRADFMADFEARLPIRWILRRCTRTRWQTFVAWVRACP